MINLREEVAKSLKGKVTNLKEIRLQAFIHTLKHVGSDNLELANHLNAVYFKHRFEDIELYDDVRPTLEYLIRHRPCGLISNGNTDPDRCGLSGIFSFVLFSQDVGVEKPDPAIFACALEQIDCQPEQLVHVGDSLESDIAGAKAAGAVSVWLNRDRQKNNSSVVPDFEISSLSELLNIIPIKDNK